MQIAINEYTKKIKKGIHKDLQVDHQKGSNAARRSPPLLCKPDRDEVQDDVANVRATPVQQWPGPQRAKEVTACTVP